MTSVAARRLGIAVAATVVAVVLVLAVTGGISMVPDTANETPSHVHPDEFEDDVDLAELQALLGAFLAGNLDASAADIGEREYEQARAVLGDEYRDRLQQYADIDAVTDDDGHTAAFNETRDEQERLADLLEAFDTLYDEFLDAAAAGEEERAIELAQELHALDDEISELTDSLLGSYDLIEDELGIDLSDARESTTDRSNETSSQATDAVEGTLSGVDLEVTIVNETASFLDPMTIEGNLETVDGEAVADEQITLVVDDRPFTTETDGTGSFSLAVRPVLLAAGETNVTVAFEPDSGQPYLGSVAADTVAVEALAPEVTLDGVPDTVAYGDELSIAGSVTVGDMAVPLGTLDATFGPSVVDTPAVDAGAFATELVVPAEVPAGATELSVAWGEEGLAIAPASTTEVIEVEASETELSVNGSVEGSITIDGALETGEGVPVADQAVAITVAGVELGTVTTDGDGTYREVFAVPDSVEPGEVSLEATFDGDGTNLDGAAASEAVVVPEPPEEDGLLTTVLAPLGDLWGWLTGVAPAWVWGLVAVWLLAVAGGGMWRRRRAAAAESAEHTVTASVDPETTSTAGVDPEVLLEEAGSHLEAGRTAAAMVLGYAAVRAHLDGEGSPLTATEFNAAHRGQLDDTSVEDLDAVTEGFERVAYADAAVEADAGAEYLDRVQRMLEAA